MYTFQDLQNVGSNEDDRMKFVMDAINDLKGSELYQTAFDAEEYDRQNNVTIMKYKKMLYDVAGRAIEDDYSPNHKIPSNFFHRFVAQENQYLLGNGVQMDGDNKKKLGIGFDQRLQKLGRNALVQGVSFGFWNLDHLEVFKLCEGDGGGFVPLYDEETASLRSGIRFFQLASDKPLRATLYEPDGYTDYVEKNGSLSPMSEDGKKSYITVTASSVVDGTEIIEGQNYPDFPIIPIWGNPHHESELVGLRQSIDAYDLIKSGFANDMDSAMIYWLFQNSEGMDDVDIAKMLERINVLHAAVGETDDGVTNIQPHQVDIPYESRVAYLERLEQDMYNDFCALNVQDLSGTQKTATEIRAAYQPFDNKVDMYEYCILDFLQDLFKIVGIDDTPSFTRNKVACENEDMQTLLMASEYLDDEYITRKACAILGDPDEADEIIKRKENLDLTRFGIVAGDSANNQVTEQEVEEETNGEIMND